MSKPSLYIGCALQAVPKSFLQMIEDIKIDVASNWDIRSFVGTDPTVTAKTVYETDITMAIEADVMLAVCDFPSTGLGIELATRITKNAPTIITHHSECTISRMVLGLVEVSNDDVVQYCAYNDTHDMIAVLDTYLK